MKSKIAYCLLLVLTTSCSSLFNDDNYDPEAYREGSDSGKLINEGSLIGKWEETYNWVDGGGERPSFWKPINLSNSDKYEFLLDSTFTSNINILNCIEIGGNYLIESKKINLKYTCQSQPDVIKEIFIHEYFFREDYIVFIHGSGNNISKFELVK
ncbi:hypothetical protein OD91_2174 [Lutibacter sp. Hel_I_33_5]|uniref:hypothetical protein n=1 Tax=Lutibacter sp. Hel_I_33_5 TaxID=1566289 RepID=UPI0011A7890E|nr:hypothetical protein [Lutibacter sp. Hel_I_33_5]TVZ56873.1 hypothetical protein OD91_2174 [Lutibacter sp. Hel_I_33_5]